MLWLVTLFLALNAHASESCFLLYDLKADKLVQVEGEARCRERMTACSTFKMPLAAMAFDAGVLKDENSSMKWDGKKRSIEPWNADQTAASWVRNSVVWYSKRITPKLGLARVQKYLADFKYGNQDVSAGLTSAWLTIDKAETDPAKGSLKISAYEQLEFLKRFWRHELRISKHAYEKTKLVTFLEKSPAGFELHGKTGSGYLPDLKGDFGWFIGHVARGEQEYLAVTAFTREGQAADARFPGMLARQLTQERLSERGLW